MTVGLENRHNGEEGGGTSIGGLTDDERRQERLIEVAYPHLKIEIVYMGSHIHAYGNFCFCSGSF